MSGLVATVNLDGTPCDANNLSRLVDALQYRGPDGQQRCVSGPVGLGHASLATTFEEAAEPHLLSLAGHTWITADVRLDGRAELLGHRVRDRGAELVALELAALILVEGRERGQGLRAEGVGREVAAVRVGERVQEAVHLAHVRRCAAAAHGRTKA